MGNILYKYLDQDGGKQVLFKNTIKFSTAHDFNDPFDCYEHLIDIDLNRNSMQTILNGGFYVKEADEADMNLDELVAKHKKLKTFTISNPLIGMAFKAVVAGVWITCFSRTQTNITMWSHYADSHKGVCIGFDKLKLVKYFNKSIDPVKYCKDLVKKDYFKEGSEAMEAMILTKANDWNYEEEERLFIPKNEKGEKKEFPTSESGIFDIPTDCICSVIIGARSTLTKEEIFAECADLKTSKSKLSKDSFSLII